VVVKEIRETIPAEINDEMAKKMGVESVDELRKNIRESQVQELNSISRMRLKRDLLDILDKEHKFELPEGIYEEQFDAIWAEFERRREDNPDQIDEDDKGKSDEELKAQYRIIAERMVRLGLLLSEIGRVNEVVVSPEELNRAVMQEAQRHKGKEKEIFAYYKDNSQALQALQSPLLEDKVVDFILELADISEREVTLEELMEYPEKSEINTGDANQQKSKKRKSVKKISSKKNKSD
ncbi:MAG TPA: trigger factor, partial [Rhodospirillales bacterium]|nr:trigger factor [Rhodospirillales bacterium]